VDGRSNVFGGYVQVDGFWELEKREEEEEEEEEEEKKEKRGSRASELCGANLPNFNTAFICCVCVFGTRQ
jgi:hypothetical protein